MRFNFTPGIICSSTSAMILSQLSEAFGADNGTMLLKYPGSISGVTFRSLLINNFVLKKLINYKKQLLIKDKTLYYPNNRQ